MPLGEHKARQLFLGAVSEADTSGAGHSGDTQDSRTVMVVPAATTAPGMAAAMTGSHGEQQVLEVTREVAKKFEGQGSERDGGT